MARIRSIKPGFWTDSKIVRLSCWARLFYIGTWNFALCEKGHLPDDAFELKLQILPADNVNVEEILEELLVAGRIERRKTDDGSTYLMITRLPNHNKSDARWATRCHYCNEENSEEKETSRRNSGEARREVGEHAEKQPRKGIGREGKGYISASDEPMQEHDSFTLQEPLTEPTFQTGSDQDPRWVQFWAVYPRKQGREEAREAWTNHVLGKGTYKGEPIKKADADRIMAGVIAYAARVKRERTERKHIKMAQGWLNGRRWEEELDNANEVDETRGVDIWALPMCSARSCSPSSTASRRPLTGSRPAAPRTRTTHRPCRWDTAPSTR